MAPSDRSSGAGWTTVADLIATLHRRWQRESYLRAYAGGAAYAPVSLPVHAPKAADLTDRLGDVQRWVERFDADNRTGTRRELFEVERKSRRTRTLGDNPLPVRAHVPSFDRLCEILGTGDEVTRLDHVLELTRTAEVGDVERAALVAWAQARPRLAAQHCEVWRGLLAVVGRIVDHGHDRSSLDVRHLDLPGIDTKFVERHRKVLSRLLEQVVPVDELDRSAATFAGRFGFRARPTYLRFRLLAPVPELPEAITEAELRVDELAELPLSASTVFIIENRATYLAFPQVPRAIAVFGGGFAVTVLEGVPWLAQRDLVYWGDIDTHGFDILDRLRTRVAGVRSLMMDRQTLLDHRDHIVVEERPTARPLATLTSPEQSLYRDLIEDRFGPAVRLEQERIRFSAVRQALAPWTLKE